MIGNTFYGNSFSITAEDSEKFFIQEKEARTTKKVICGRSVWTILSKKRKYANKSYSYRHTNEADV